MKFSNFKEILENYYNLTRFSEVIFYRSLKDKKTDVFLEKVSHFKAVKNWDLVFIIIKSRKNYHRSTKRWYCTNIYI